MLLVTGGAGFIGSNVVASLNQAGRADIAVNDSLGDDGKWRIARYSFSPTNPPPKEDRARGAGRFSRKARGRS